MRLTSHQHEIIRQTVTTAFGIETKIWLFGSRVDDAKRGGDVDLYLEPTRYHDLMTKIHCKIALQDQLDLPIDLVVCAINKDKPIYKIAKLEGIPL